MPLIERHSLERRVIDHLLEHYPVTAFELAKALRVPEKRMILELRRMEARGMVEMDILPDKIFVRCLVKVRNPPAPGTRPPAPDGKVEDPAYR
jgi:hypothetical protein